jgi:hypothetical protein
MNAMAETIGDAEVFVSIREGSEKSALRLLTENSALAIEIAKGRGVFRLKHAVSSLDEAERRVSEFLRSWEADVLLQGGPVRRDLEIFGSRATGESRQRAHVRLVSSMSGEQAEANTRLYFPWRRHRFWDDPLLASLIARYEAYRRGRERLTVLGFLCLTALNSAFGGRKALELRLRIDAAVLREFSRLVSTVGGYDTARKISAQHELRDLTTCEVHWVESVVRELIQRAGSAAVGEQLATQLALKDLPSLRPAAQQAAAADRGLG